MKKHRIQTTSVRTTGKPPFPERALAALILAGTLLTPLVISWRGEDHFRLPKELLVVAVAILCVVVFAAGALVGRRRWPWSGDRLPLLIAGAAFAWGIVSTIASTSRPLSVQALVWGASLGVVWLASSVGLRRVRPVTLAVAMFVPALVNGVLVLLQTFGLWNPWTFDTGMPQRLTRNALLGNPNDVGAYLACVTLFAMGMLVSSRRWPYGVVAAICATAVFATETITAIVALFIALIAMLIMVRPRLGLAAAVVSPLLVAGILLLYPATNARLRAAEASIRAGDWGSVMSGRLPPFLAAWEIFRDHPLLGSGPGTFRQHYLPYYSRLEERYPSALAGAPRGSMFVETHNDHLQLLAETGLPGYLLVAGGIAVIAIRISRRAQGIARLLALPTATLLLVLMLAGFPLHLAAPAWTCAVMGGAALAWSDPDVA